MEYKIIEALDYGRALLDTGDVLNADGTIITKEDFAKLQVTQAQNVLDWHPIDTLDFDRLSQESGFIAKTYSSNDNNIEKTGFAGVDDEGTPYYIRVQVFAGNESIEFTEATFGKLIYNIAQNRDDLIEELTAYLEAMFGTTEQVGSTFSPDSENSYLTKLFIKDGYQWKMVFRNGQLSNIKQGNKITSDAEVNSNPNELKNSINAKLASGAFANIK